MSSPKRRDHARLAHEYAESVVAGKIPSCAYVVQAAQRHLEDLKRQKSAAYPYEFDADRGAKVCRFIEHLPHTKGRWAEKGELLILGAWQCFLVVVLFGWVRKDKGAERKARLSGEGTDLRKRRFRSVYWEIPRKNGKSPLAAAIGNYMLLADGEFGAEVYSGATTEKQAWEVFKPAKLMLERTPKLRDHFGAEVCAKVIIKARDSGKFEPIIGNPGDGASPSCAIIDEYHEHQTPALYDTMETGMGAREQPLLLIITTAGYSAVGPCRDKRDEVIKVLNGSLENEQLFGVIYGIDPEDDWADPKSLIKANPNYGVSVDADFLLAQQRQAMANTVQQNRFKTKHLNVWCSVLQGWMNMQLLTLSIDRMLEEEELIGEDCWIGIDLASKTDLCAEQRLYRKFLNGKPHYYLFGRYWLPEETIEEPGNNHAHYIKWVKQGLLTPTEGAVVDFEMITAQVIEDCKKFHPREVVYDPFNATPMAQAIMSAGIKGVVEFQQTPWNFALPMDELQSALKDGRFHYDGNEITTWCFSNVVARPAKKGMFSPIKAKEEQKIDGAVAALMTLARAISTERKKQYQMLSL